MKLLKEYITKLVNETITEKWSKKYKASIDCNKPKGFSQKAHCQGKKKHLKEQPIPNVPTKYDKDVTISSTKYDMPVTSLGNKRELAVGNEKQTYNIKSIRNRKNEEELGTAVAATAAAFVPFIGWAVSAAILGYDAYNKFQEGKFRQGGSSTLFAILSVAIPALKFRNLYILSKMPKNEIAQLGTKVASGANLTKTEIQAVNEVINNADEIGKGIENLAKSKNLATAQPASKFSSAVEKFKGEYLPYIAGKAGYEGGWETISWMNPPKK